MELSEHSKEVAKGSLWSLLGSAAFKLSSFFYVILVARAASQDDVGLFYLVLGMMFLVSMVSDLGITAALVRYVPYFQGKKEGSKVKTLLTLSHKLLTITGIVIGAVLFLSADLIGNIYQNPSLPEAIRIMAVYVFLFNIFRLHYLFLQGMADIKGSQLVQNIQNFLKLVLTALLFYLYGANILTIAIAFLLSHVFALLFSSVKILGVSRALPIGDKTSQAELIREIAPLGLMLAAIQYFSMIIASADRLLLGYLTEPSSASAVVAIYSMSTTFAVVLTVFPSSVGNIFLPVVSRLAGKNELHKMNEVMETAQRWMLFITLPIAVVMMSFSGEMLGAFYGDSYAPGAATMAIFTFGVVLNSIYFIISLALAALRMVGIELKIAVAAGILNLALNIVLIPVYGMEGAAFASVVSFALALILSAYYGNKLFGFRFPSEVYRLLGASLLALFIILAIKPLFAWMPGVLAALVGGESQPYLSKISYLAFIGALVVISMALFALFALLLKSLREEDVLLMEGALKRARIPQNVISFASKAAHLGVGEKPAPMAD